ncbi:MAG TPA: LLM class flavin-dependent oxidoreductase [Ohtaekwangia sp.]|nr:LLM class flavin-dependent oxidoreductase [Ohtaekwangia sp.]
MKIQLSVLDQTPIRRDSNAKAALRESLHLARAVDHWGYTRYWLSEHHNIPTLAGAAPEVMIARLAGETKNLRFGSGGIMLPNHSTLKVAENFRLLEGLFPGRIDLGIGRAPGGDRLTASLLNPANTFNPQDYFQQITDLIDFLSGEAQPGTIHEKVKAIPVLDTMPELWMLTSSGESAYLAAHFGMAVSFAHFINPVGGPEAVHAYRERFKPSERLHEPMANVGIFVFCADTEEKAAQMQAVMDYRLLSLEKGKIDESPSYESIKSYSYSDQEWTRVLYNRHRMIAGTPDAVKEQLLLLARRYGVNEIVVATFADHFEDRLRSYELLADIFALQPKAQAVI